MKHEQVTIKDLAKSLNISPATVSRALRNLPEVNAHTKRAVRELAHEMDYRPNYMAQSLVKSKSNCIGIVIPNITTSFFASAVVGIQEVVTQAGYYTMICHSGEQYETEIINVRNLVSSNVDGLIISLSGETKDCRHFKQLEKKGVPMVFFDRVCDEVNASKVMVNDYEGAFNAVEHLILSGCKRIAHLSGNKALSICKNRMEGYLDALKQYQISIDHDIILHCGFNTEHIIAATKRLIELPNPPDAIFAVSDPVAIQAMLVIKKTELKIPEDVAIIGFGNEPVASIIEPSLTSVDQNPEELGRVAAYLFLKGFEENKYAFQPQTKVLKTELIIRNSSLLHKN